jgi:acylphosphatase
MPEIISRTITVSGKVQGVYFRYHTKSQADKLSLNGFVCNEQDGTVFIFAEGPSENLQKLIEWCRHGPPDAVVENVEVKEVSRQGLTEFSIRR